MPHGFCSWLPDDTAAPSLPAAKPVSTVLQMPPPPPPPQPTKSRPKKAGYTAFVHISDSESSAFYAPTADCAKCPWTSSEWVVWIQKYGAKPAKQLPRGRTAHLKGYDEVVICDTRVA